LSNRDRPPDPLTETADQAGPLTGGETGKQSGVSEKSLTTTGLTAAIVIAAAEEGLALRRLEGRIRYQLRKRGLSLHTSRSGYTVVDRDTRSVPRGAPVNASLETTAKWLGMEVRQ